LNLKNNSIGSNRAHALAEALKTNSTLTTLDLQKNSIGDNGVQSLAEALKTNLSLTILDLQYNTTGDKGAQELQQVFQYGRSSSAYKPFFGVTFGWLDKEFNKYGCDLAPAPMPYPHDAATTTQLVQRILKDYNLFDCIVAATTDGELVMKKTMQYLSAPPRVVEHILSVAHALNNCVKSGLKPNPRLLALVGQYHDLVTFFHGSSKITQALIQEQNEWNTCLVASISVKVCGLLDLLTKPNSEQ
ncbi:hypothetical protein BGZ59_003420, partial [Podila verticillata]